MKTKLPKYDHQEEFNSERAEYGISYADTFNLDHSLGIIISNALFAFIEESGKVDFDRELVKKHALAIKYYATSDYFSDGLYDKKREAFEEAMRWLVEEWEGLWW